MNLRRCNLVAGFLTIALGIYVLTGASELPDRAAAVPDLIAWTLIILGAVLVTLNTLVSGTVVQLTTLPYAGKPWNLISIVMLLLVVYGFMVSRVGFYEMSVPFVAVVSFAMVWKEDSSIRRKALQSTLYAGAFTAVLYVVFNNLLGVPTPDGLLIS